jgi:hypothetical protein
MKARKSPIIIFFLISISLMLIWIFFSNKPKTKDTKFTGVITETINGCGADDICSIKVDDKWVIAEIGGLMPSNATREPRGQLIGINFANGMNAYIGKKVEVYAKQSENDTYYSIYGSPNYYIKVVQ